MIRLSITPVPKARETRWTGIWIDKSEKIGDPVTKAEYIKEKKIAPAIRYRAFKNQLNALMNPLDLPECFHVVFVLPMPKSWTNIKKRKIVYTEHLQRPDADNLIKSLFDALFNQETLDAQFEFIANLDFKLIEAQGKDPQFITARADDSHIWHTTVTKIWGYSGAILIKPIKRFNLEQFLGYPIYDYYVTDCPNPRSIFHPSYKKD